MFIDFNDAPEGGSFNADICIVGAGAAGITLAKELIPTGKRILLIEGGDLKPSEASQSLYRIARSRPFFDPARSRLRYFGGSTNHWEGGCRAFDPIDFERRSWVADSGWPFSYQDLLPYYDRAFVYVEAGKRFDDESTLMRPLQSFGTKFAASGFHPRVGYSSPPTRFGSRYIEDLRAAANLTVLTRANLMSINESPDRHSVNSLTVCNYKDQKGTVSATSYVIALGGIENARALLLSDAVTPGGVGNERDLVGRYFMDHPVIESMVFFPAADLARAWGAGWDQGDYRYPRFFQASEGVLRRNNLTNARMPLDSSTKIYTSRGIESAHQIEKAISRGEMRDILTNLGYVIGDVDLVLEQWRRKNGYRPMKTRADEYGGHVSNMMMEQRPIRDNRILLTNERDSLGLRKARIDWRLPESEKEDFKRLVTLFAKGMGAQGLGVVRSFLADDGMGRRFEELINFGHHHMGTTRASANPKTGVVDADQRVHGRANLYMAGSSIFPTGSHVPPTTTIVATTIRLADHLKKRFA